jgi:hypothetical protein
MPRRWSGSRSWIGSRRTEGFDPDRYGASPDEDKAPPFGTEPLQTGTEPLRPGRESPRRRRSPIVPLRSLSGGRRRSIVPIRSFSGWRRSASVLVWSPPDGDGAPPSRYGASRSGSRGMQLANGLRYVEWILRPTVAPKGTRHAKSSSWSGVGRRLGSGLRGCTARASPRQLSGSRGLPLPRRVLQRQWFGLRFQQRLRRGTNLHLPLKPSSREGGGTWPRPHIKVYDRVLP